MIPIGLGYEVVEKYGLTYVEISVSSPGESVVIASIEANPDYPNGGAEGAGLAMIVDGLTNLWAEAE